MKSLRFISDYEMRHITFTKSSQINKFDKTEPLSQYDHTQTSSQFQPKGILKNTQNSTQNTSQKQSSQLTASQKRSLNHQPYDPPYKKTTLTPLRAHTVKW